MGGRGGRTGSGGVVVGAEVGGGAAAAAAAADRRRSRRAASAAARRRAPGVRVRAVAAVRWPGRSGPRRCSGCRAAWRRAKAARLGKVAGHTAGGRRRRPGVGVGVRVRARAAAVDGHRWPWECGWSRARAGRSCWTRDTCP